MSRIANPESDRLKIGYVPMTDCAPIVAAHELHLFKKHGLSVKLCREPGWATVREKMLHWEIDASQAPASMVFELSYGLDVVSMPSITGLVTALNGNAITLSNELWELGVRDAHSLRRLIDSMRGTRRFRFAGVLKYSSQNYLMRQWLRSGGIDPDYDVEMAVVPPPLVHDCLKQGHLDGYCVAEPWSSIGLIENIGWCATLTSDFDPMHPEKVFMVRRDFDEHRHDEHLRLLAALIEAAAFCDAPESKEELVQMLARPEYINVEPSALRNALIGPFDMGCERETDPSDSIIFHRDDAGRPTFEKAKWVTDQIFSNFLGNGLPELNEEEVATIYREDIYEEACALASVSSPIKNKQAKQKNEPAAVES